MSLFVFSLSSWRDKDILTQRRKVAKKNNLRRAPLTSKIPVKADEPQKHNAMTPATTSPFSLCVTGALYLEPHSNTTSRDRKGVGPRFRALRAQETHPALTLRARGAKKIQHLPSRGNDASTECCPDVPWADARDAAYRLTG